MRIGEFGADIASRVESGPGSRKANIFGRRVTIMLGEIILEHGINAGADSVARAAKQHSLDIPRGWQRMRVEQGLDLAVAGYLRHCALRPPWTLIGAEVLVFDCRVDLLWVSPFGFAIDEIKRHVESGPLSDKVAEQCGRYLAAGTIQFGPLFVGLRLISLTSLRPVRIFAGSIGFQDDER